MENKKRKFKISSIVSLLAVGLFAGITADLVILSFEKEVTIPIIQENTPRVAQVLIPSQTKQHVGEVATVEYFVEKTFLGYFGMWPSRSHIFLWAPNAEFATTILADSKSKFDDPISLYDKRKIRVTGLIQKYKRNPEIVINDPSQIEIVE